ncbi:hypothetical protein M434DRAFT_398985 [Hypoxylon sp. CO27-5]|nr:hypothetical protein M434DRAFT_398985 [Hypoxylon sp. CO27-5]
MANLHVVLRVPKITPFSPSLLLASVVMGTLVPPISSCVTYIYAHIILGILSYFAS